MQSSNNENEQFNSWHRALTESRLTAEQLAVLTRMVEDGQAADIEGAASILDWQDSVIDPEEHMYGF